MYAGWTPLVMLVVGGVVGFVIGVLVYRNNAKLFEKKYRDAVVEIESLKQKLGVK